MRNSDIALINVAGSYSSVDGHCGFSHTVLPIALNGTRVPNLIAVDDKYGIENILFS